MQDTDAKQFRNVIAGMGRMFGQEIDSVMLDMYWMSLKSWSLEEFKSAAAHLLGSCKFMPKPADFNDLRKASRLTAGEAWSKAREIVRSGGSASGDAAIDAAVRALGGYRALGMTNSDQMHFLERRFAEHYESISDAEDVRESCPALTFTKKLDGPRSLKDMLRSA